MAFLDNALTQSLDLRTPLWQAPLPFELISSQTTGEISAAGALGIITIGESSNCRQLQDALAQYGEYHQQPGICFSHRLPQSPHWQIPQDAQGQLQHLAHQYQIDYPLPKNDHFLDLLDTAIQASPRLIGFANGIPEKDTIAFIQSQQIPTFAICHSVAEAIAAADFGIDYLVLQGVEAGGEQHRFENALPELRQSALALLQQVRNHVSLPIVLWGDFTHGADIVGALLAGAQAVMLDRPLLQCTLSAEQIEVLKKSSEYDFRTDYRFTNRALRYLPIKTDTPNLDYLDPMLRQVFMEHYFRQYPEAKPLSMSVSANQLPTTLHQLLNSLNEQMRHYLG